VKDNISDTLKVDLRSKPKVYIFICTSKPQSTYVIMPGWNI